MADKKISQLPAATTPLAGTEELAIVQSGDTKKVAASVFQRFDANTAKLNVAQTWAATQTFGRVSLNTALSTDRIGNLSSGSIPLTIGVSSLIDFKIDDLLRMQIGSTGDISLYNDAQVAKAFWDSTNESFCFASGITLGNGIVYSAGNTLDDYEEGTWTPVQGAGLTVVGDFTSVGTYTKVGRVVTVRGFVQGSTSVSCASGATICSGLPFNSAVDSAGSFFNGDLSAGGAIDAAGNVIAVVGAVSATTNIYFTATYMV
jgi:hypothetical protein